MSSLNELPPLWLYPMGKFLLLTFFWDTLYILHEDKEEFLYQDHQRPALIVSHPDLLVTHHPTHFFRSHRSSTLDFHFLSHYSYIKAIMLYKGETWQDSGILWNTLAYSGILWHTLAYSGILWHTLAYSGILWHTLAYSGILWHTLTHPGILWHTLAYSNTL